MKPRHQYKLISGVGSLLILIGMAGTVVSEELDAHWIYLSGQGAWIEERVRINRYPADIPLPAQTQAVWWQALPEDEQVVHHRSLHRETLRPGTVVRVNQPYAQHRVSAGTELTVAQVFDTGIVLTDGRTGFLIAPEDYSTLSIPLAVPPGESLRFESTAIPGERRIAWQTSELTGAPQYRLQDVDEGSATLRQFLVIENLTDEVLLAQGLSYQPVSSDRGIMMPRALSTEMATTSGPVEITSDVRAAIQLEQVVQLSPQSRTWLPMTEQVVDVQHEFTFEWYFNSVRNQAARWYLQIGDDQALPRLSGPLSVGWFDGLYGSQETHFQREFENTARLDLGQSDQVTLRAERVSGEQWGLTLTNHLDNPVEITLALQYRVPGSNESRQTTWRSEIAPGSHRLQVSGSAQGIEIE